LLTFLAALSSDEQSEVNGLAWLTHIGAIVLASNGLDAASRRLATPFPIVSSYWENVQLIDFARRQKRKNCRNCAQLERIWNASFLAIKRTSGPPLYNLLSRTVCRLLVHGKGISSALIDLILSCT
jgi:hypothetical protein